MTNPTIEYNGEIYNLNNTDDIKCYIGTLGLDSRKLGYICWAIDSMQSQIDGLSDVLREIGDLTLVRGNWQPTEPAAHRGMIAAVKSLVERHGDTGRNADSRER